MARAYLSFLGTNDYLNCTYFKNNKELKNVRFVQQATLYFYCREWTSEDRILIFTTDEAYEKNWLDNGHRGPEGNILKRTGLERCIESLKLSPPVKRVPIPEGKSEKEIWDIFNKVFEQLNQGEEVIFDITHAFRSIPMLAIVVLNYAKVMKDITLQGIYYGALEVLGNIKKVKDIPVDKRRVPIFDLTSFDMLMDWTLAIDRFVKSGDAAQISVLANSSARSILSDTKGKDRSPHILRNIANNLDEFTKALSTCRGLEISGIVNKMQKNINQLELLDYIFPVPFKPVFHKIKNQIKLFNGDIISDGIQAVKWCHEHNLIQQGYTILEEMLISYCMTQIGQKPQDWNKREIVNQAVHIYLYKTPESEWREDVSENKNNINELLNFFDGNTQIAKLMRNLSQDRNDLNHAGYNPNPMQADKFTNKLQGYIEKVENYIAI